MNGKRPTVTIQLTARWLLGLLALLFLVQIVVPSRVWTVLLVGVGGALALGYLWVSQLARHLALHRQRRYGWAHVGDVLEERFAVQNRSLLGAVWLEIDDRSDLPGYSANTVRSVEGRQTLRWRTQATCRQRGLFTLGPWRVHTGDPLGLYRLTLDFAESQSVLVYPPVVHLPELRLPRGIATGAGRTSRRALDVTTHAAGVRGYAPGDSIRQVHWPSTARHDTLMVKTFDLEPSGDLWIVLDLDDSVQAGEGEESTVEYGVILAASLASQSLGENRAVGLVAYGSDESGHVPMPTLVLPQKGKAQEWRILEVLATARTGGHWPLSRVLAEMDRNLGRGTILALITPSCQADWVAGLLPPMRRGVTPTVLLLDPASFGGQGNVEPLTALLANLGVTTHRIVQGMPFRPIAEHKRLGPPMYKVLPGYGRVIPVSE